MRISACLICKNEENNISKWINNVKQFADEIIIVDTGSKDNTINLIRENGIKPYSFTWNDDFSAAKNYAIDKATGDYIVFTDSDEFFENPAEVRHVIEKVVMNDNTLEAIMVPLYNINEDFHNAEISHFNAIRIFRNKENLRYYGKIHECICHIGMNGDISDLKIYVAGDELRVNHTGYSTSIVKEKLIRNLNLLNDDIDKNGLQDKHYRYLAECFYGLGNYEQALKFSAMAIDSPMQAVGQLGDMYWIAVDCLKELRYPIEEQKAFAEKAINSCSEIPDFYAILGLLLYENNEEEAIDYLYKSLQVYADEKENVYSSNFSQIVNQVQTVVGKILLSNGFSKESKNIFLEVLQTNKWDEYALMGLTDVYDCQGYKELLDYLNEIYNYKNNEENEKLLVSVLENNGAIELVRALRGIEDEKYVLLRENNFDKIEETLPKEIIDDLQKFFLALLGSNLDITSYTVKKQLELLPGNLKDIVLCYHNLLENDKISGFYGEYDAMLVVVLNHDNREIKQRYLGMAVCFTEAEIIATANKARNANLWEEALTLYQQIPENSDYINYNFWLGAGVSLYYLENYEAAAECLEKALITAVNEGKNEAESYLAWCREEMA